MTTPNEATEAAAQRPWAAASSEADHVEILAQDTKAARILAKAEAKRIEAQDTEAGKDREAARKAKAEADRFEAEAIKAARAEVKAERRAKRLAEAKAQTSSKAKQLLASVRGEAAASYAGFIYLIVVSVAIGSQFVFFKRLIDSNASLATLHAVSGFAALLAALFVEGFGLAFYATSVASRLRNRGGWVPRVLAWTVTGFAAYLQFQAHRDLLFLDKPLLSYACAAASVGAMLLAEVRTTYKVGETLEALDQKDKPQARLGVKFCVRYPRPAWWAFSAMIANPKIRTRSTALAAGQKLAQLRDEADFNATLMREAKKALRAAQKKDGTSDAVLAQLNALAQHGVRKLAAQAQLASAATFLVAQGFADTEAAAQEATMERPKATKATAQVAAQSLRPTAQEARPTPRPTSQIRPISAPPAQPASAQRPAQLTGDTPAFEDWTAEAWAERPNGPEAWTQRVAELASVFPIGLPGRAEIIETMKLRQIDPELPPLRFAWTNKGYVGWAMADLKALRAEGYADPRLDDETIAN